MKTLSANTLFHFTGTKENLINILKNSFYPRYCIEENKILKAKKWLVPMTCFCDIPLSQIEEHVQWYGEYAIGMTKEWGVANNINPVLYINDNSHLIKNLKDCVNFAINKKKEGDENIDNQSIIFKHMYQYAFFKPYEGKQMDKKSGRNITKRFYDEREWRYVPRTNEIRLFKLYKPDIDVSKNTWNKEMECHALGFEPKFINYIIVSKESEILDLMDEIQRIKGEYPYDDVRLLTTRIFSMERIKQDF